MKFGSMAASKDAHRDSRGVPWLERFICYWSPDFIKQAARLWIRQATRQVVLTVFLVLSLAVSLAGGVFALSLNSAVLWRNLPFDNPRDPIAVRRAIGASDRQIVSWYVSEWATVVVPGLAGGWILQWFWTSTLVAAIQGLQAPTAFAVILGISVMAVAAALAAMVPLRRALVADSSSLMRSS